MLGTIARHEDSRIAGTGGNWCGALEHSRYANVAEFFRERVEMCNIDRVYRGATKPFRPNLSGSRYSSNVQGFHDEDPVLAGDTADDAADKLHDLFQYYNRLPNSKKFVIEQRLNTKNTGVVQYGKDTEKLHRDQAELRRLVDCRIETAEAQISIVDGDIQTRNEARRDMDKRLLESNPPKNKLERLRLQAIKKRSNHWANMRERVHEDQVENEYARCDKMNALTLHDQAVEERVHQWRSLRKIGFAREWTKRRVRWQLNNNSVTSLREEWNQATLAKQKAASDRVDTQRLIRQKWIEYRRELNGLKRLYADLAAQREKARQEARSDAVAAEMSRMSLEEAHPSPSPMRRSKTFSSSMGSTAFSIGSMGSNNEFASSAAPFSPLLKQPRVVKRIARFDFPRTGSSFMSSSPTASTRSGTMSGGSTLRQSTSMPGFAAANIAEIRGLQQALTYN